MSASRWALDRDFHANFDSVSCAELFPYASKPGNFNMEYADPCLLAQFVLTRCPRLAQRWCSALRQHKGTASNPWRCIVGYDEFQPGDKFDFDKAKLVMCLYFNFAEVDAACQGSTWFCPVSVRATEADSVVGGWSRVMSCVLHRMFLGPNGFSTVGVAFTHRGCDYVVFAYLASLMSDGDGIRKGIGWRGSSSLRPSIIHGNILKKNSDLAGRAPGFVEITCSDHRELHKTTAAEFHDSCDLVAEAFDRWHTHRTLAKGLYDNILKTEGLNYVPGGIAFDTRLRGRVNFFDALTVDWAHTWLQDGVLTVEAGLMIRACAPRLTPSHLTNFLRRPWQFPQSMGAKGKLLWRIFDFHRLDDHGEVDKVRASVSELLGLYGLLRHYFATEVVDRPELLPHWRSFEACCRVLDLILAAKKKLVSPKRAASILRVRISRFMELHLACYGSESVRPKHAWQWAIAEHWERDDEVWDALVIERLHLTVKSTAIRLRSLVRMERTLLSGTLNAQISSLETLNGPCCLLDNRPMTMNGLPHTLFADSVQVWGMSLSVGDVAFHRDNAGKVLACVLEEGSFYCILEMFAPSAVLTPHAKRWRLNTGDVKFIPAQELEQAPGPHTNKQWSQNS